MLKSRLLPTLGLALLAGVASAASPIGSWIGKVQITKMPTIPANVPAQQRAFIQQQMAMASKVRLQLTLKADKSYTMRFGGIPGAEKQPPHVGKWSQKGNVVTTMSTTVKGPPQNLTLSADGKTMTMIAPGNRGNIVFTR